MPDIWPLGTPSASGLQLSSSQKAFGVRYLAAMNRGLGISQVLSDAMSAPAKHWFGYLARSVLLQWARLPEAAIRAFRGYPSQLSCLHGPTVTDVALCACFLWGELEGLARLARIHLAGNPTFIGCVASRGERRPP
jgi:hypothetical protein